MMIRACPVFVAVCCWLSAWPAVAAQEPEQQPEKSRVIGQVTVDADPLEGALVVLEGLDTDDACRRETDEEGEYGCRVTPGRYRLSVSVEGRLLGAREVTVERGMGSRFDIPLTSKMLEPPKDTEQLEAKFQNARSLLNQGRYGKAAALLEELVAENPEQWGFHTELAAAYTGTGNLEEASAHYRKAIALNPGEARLHIDLASVYAQQGRLKEARAEVETAVQIDPEVTGLAYHHLGRALYVSGQTEPALAPLRKAAELEPERPLTHYLLGICLYSNAETKVEGDQSVTVLLPGTRESFERYLELAPEGPFAADARAMLQAIEATPTTQAESGP